MKNKIFGIIYKITNLINNKIYIGQTRQTINKRKSQHKYHSNKKNPKFYISRAIKKYGINNFTFEMIDKAYDQVELNLLEEKYINLYNSYNKEFGYNIEKISNGKIEVSISTREKLKLIHSNPKFKKRMSSLGLSSRCKKLPNKITKSKFIGLEKCGNKWRVRVKWKNTSNWN